MTGFTYIHPHCLDCLHLQDQCLKGLKPVRDAAGVDHCTSHTEVPPMPSDEDSFINLEPAADWPGKLVMNLEKRRDPALDSITRAAVCNAACVELKMFRALEAPPEAGPFAIAEAYHQHKKWLRVALSLSQSDLERYCSTRLATLAEIHPVTDQAFVVTAIKTLMPLARKETTDVTE
jgi:hypothetical protein